MQDLRCAIGDCGVNGEREEVCTRYRQLPPLWDWHAYPINDSDVQRVSLPPKPLCPTWVFRLLTCADMNTYASCCPACSASSPTTPRRPYNSLPCRSSQPGTPSLDVTPTRTTLPLHGELRCIIEESWPGVPASEAFHSIPKKEECLQACLVSPNPRCVVG